MEKAKQVKTQAKTKNINELKEGRKASISGYLHRV